MSGEAECFVIDGKRQKRREIENDKVVVIMGENAVILQVDDGYTYVHLGALLTPKQAREVAECLIEAAKIVEARK